MTFEIHREKSYQYFSSMLYRMPQVNISGVVEDTGTAIDPATFIRVAENADLADALVYDSSKTLDVSTTVLPGNLQTELANCDGNYGCKYIGYDFDHQQVVPTTGGEPKLLELQPFVQPNVGVFVKKDVDPIEFESLPTYDISYTAYVGVPLRTITPSVPAPEACADRCDTLGNCEGFNYNSLTNTCALFPTGREKGYTGVDVSFKKHIKFSGPWTYVPGESDLDPKYYTCAGTSSVTNKCTIWRTQDLKFVTSLPGGYTFWNVSRVQINSCNSEIRRLLNDNTKWFTTTSLKACKGLPDRSFKKLTATFVAGDENKNSFELNPSLFPGSTVADLAYDMIHFGELPMTMPPNGYYLDGTSIGGLGGRTSMNGFNGLYCGAGQRPSFFGCIQCTETLGTNSYWLQNTPTSWCQKFQCPPQKYVDYGVDYSASVWIGSKRAEGYYCASSPNGKLVYTDPNGIVSLQDCTNTLPPGVNYNSVGYSSSSSTICPTQSCLWSVPLYDKEIWSSSGCTKTQLNYGEIRASGSYTTSQQCPALNGQRYFYLHPQTCDQCSVPVGKDRVPASGSFTYYSNGTKYNYSVVSPGMTGYPEYGCLSTPCPRSPGALEIWDVASSNLCAIRTCSNDDIPNADQTACIPRPGFTSLCDLDSDCICNNGTTKSNGQCIELPPVNKGYMYFGGTTGRSCSSLIMPRLTSQVYSYDCTTRTCFATTTPDTTSSNPTECVRCGTEPYNSGTTRYGYISNVQGGGIYGAYADPTIGGHFLTGCTLGICPAPPPNSLFRWKYGMGCDWVQCPRAPSTAMPTSTTPGERWSGDFGCDITSWTYAIGQTTCTTFPSAGNYWTNSYGCGISACRRALDLGCDAGFVKITNGPYSSSFPDEENKYCRLVKPASGCPAGTTTFVNDTTYCYKALNTTPALSATNGEIWGPSCTIRSPVAWDDIPNTSNTYFLKCTNWPDPGKKFGNTPCTIEPCNFTPARGYVWKFSTGGTCETQQCLNYTFPDSTATRCLPCPVDTKTVGTMVTNSVNYGRYGWRKQTAPTFQDLTPYNNLCRVDGCSEISGQTLSQGQYWADVACSVKNMCAPGSEVIGRWNCTPCSTVLQLSSIWTTPGTCAISACGIQTQPNATSNVCVACPLMTLAFGYTYTMTQGCTTTACPAIASSNIWTTNGSCESTACMGHTQPNAAKTSCVACPDPPLGNQWSSADGCAYTACSAIPVSNVFSAVGTCVSMACTGRSQPNATKSACAPCQNLLIGNTWSSTDGCAYTACPAIASNSIWTMLGTCASTVCTGRSQPDATKTSCVACPDPPIGNRWSSTDGCGYTACSAIVASNVFTTVGTCDNAPCTTDHTTPNATQTQCVPCPDPPLGNAWSFSNGCRYTACPAIPSTNIFTVIGACDNAQCSGHTIPNASKSSCNACTSPSYGNIWSSSDGCGVSMCPNILPGNRYDSSTACTSSACTGFPTNVTWDPTDTRGGCRFTCTVLPGQKIRDQSTCALETFKVLMSTSSININFTVAPNLNYSIGWDPNRPTHYIQLSAGGSFTFDIPGTATTIRIVANGLQYFMHISIGFNSWIASNSNEYNYKQKIYVYFTDSTGAKLSVPPTSFNLMNAFMSFGVITDFACDNPAPGFTYDTGCTTKSCSVTLAPGFFWDPSGGCTIYSCSTTLGITLGYNQFWSGTGCIVSTCPVGTVLTNGTCAAVCDPTKVTIDSSSIYVPRQGLTNLPTCPAYSVAGVPGDWVASSDCSIQTLVPGATYKFSTCLTNTQNYTGSCEPYDLTSGQSADCSIYVASGSAVLIGPLVANGQVVSGTTSVDLYDDQNNLISSDTSGLIDILINGPSRMYTLRQRCTSGPCRGRSGYSGAATASNFQYNKSGLPMLYDGNGNIYDVDTNGTGCDNNPPFYEGMSITVSLSLDSVGPYVFNSVDFDSIGIQGQPVITVPSDSYCMTQPCVGRTQPDTSKMLCQACTTMLSPGITWASTNGCTTKTCTNTPSIGNTWSSTDTTGTCAVMACSTALITGQYWASSGFCATGMCTKGQTVNATKTGCTACATISTSNIFTTVGTCSNTACTGRTQPDATKMSCATCTCPPGQQWSSTSGCLTQACTNAVPYGNIWDSTDTNGACRQLTCSNWDYIIPGMRIGTSSCTSLTSCTGLTSGNGWDPTYDTFSSTCRQAPIVFVPRVTFSITGFTAKYALLKDATSTYGSLAFTTSDARDSGMIITSTGTASPALQTGFTHIRLRDRGTTIDRYFFISQPYTLGDTNIYGYMVDPVTNQPISKWFTATSRVLESPVYFGTMCPSPYTALPGGQYPARSNTCSAIATCATPASYGQYYMYPGIACDIGTCSTSLVNNQYYTSTGSCSAVSNCSQVVEGFKYSSRTSNSTCPGSVVACPTPLSGTNGWVTDLTGAGTCAQKVLTWTTVATVSTGTVRLTVGASPTTAGGDAQRVANPQGTAYIAHPTTGTPLSSWGSNIPASGTYTHIRFTLSGNTTQLTLHLTSVPATAKTDTKLYGFFINSPSTNTYSTGMPAWWTANVSYEPVPGAGFTTRNFVDGTIIFGKYT